MAYKQDGEWIFDRKEIDDIFEKAINKKLKPKGALSESEIMAIGRELDVDSIALRNAIVDVKSSSVTPRSSAAFWAPQFKLTQNGSTMF